MKFRLQHLVSQYCYLLLQVKQNYLLEQLNLVYNFYRQYLYKRNNPIRFRYYYNHQQLSYCMPSDHYLHRFLQHCLPHQHKLHYVEKQYGQSILLYHHNCYYHRFQIPYWSLLH